MSETTVNRQIDDTNNNPEELKYYGPNRLTHNLNTTRVAVKTITCVRHYDTCKYSIDEKECGTKYSKKCDKIIFNTTYLIDGTESETHWIEIYYNDKDEVIEIPLTNNQIISLVMDHNPDVYALNESMMESIDDDDENYDDFASVTDMK
jgi:hypothetical protein